MIDCAELVADSSSRVEDKWIEVKGGMGQIMSLVKLVSTCNSVGRSYKQYHHVGATEVVSQILDGNIPYWNRMSLAWSKLALTIDRPKSKYEAEDAIGARGRKPSGAQDQSDPAQRQKSHVGRLIGLDSRKRKR